MNWDMGDLFQIVVFALLSLSSALVGPLLVLRRKTMLANSISHTVLLGIALSYGLQLWMGFGLGFLMLAILGCSFLVAWLTTYLTHHLHKTIGLQEDASIGLVFSGLFAFGVVAISCVFRNSHIGIEVIMGSADALTSNDLFSCFLALIFNAALTFCLYRSLIATTFDPMFSRSLGFSPSMTDYLLMLQTTLTVMVGFRAVGSFLVLAILVAPAICARPWVSSLKSLMLGSALVSLLSSVTAVFLSRLLFDVFSAPLSTAGLMVTILTIACALSWGLKSSSRFKRKKIIF